MGIRRIGYPCIRVDGEEQTVRTCQLKNASESRLKELVTRNLQCLRNVLAFNVDNDIRFFRIHSDTIPFASHPEVDFDWLEYAGDDLSDLGNYIRDRDIRISMHPGQYTVLNSEDDSVVEDAVRNLEYHTNFLDALDLESTAKIVLHVGGVYGDREAAISRFVDRVRDLPSEVRDRLVIENDERSYHVEHVLNISDATDLPVVFDWLHHRLHKPDTQRDAVHWLEDCFASWSGSDGVPIVHFSSASGQGGGHHADRIDAGEFKKFESMTDALDDFDVMLECKDKEVALMQLRDELGESAAGSSRY